MYSLKALNGWQRPNTSKLRFNTKNDITHELCLKFQGRALAKAMLSIYTN